MVDTHGNRYIDDKVTGLADGQVETVVNLAAGRMVCKRLKGQELSELCGAGERDSSGANLVGATVTGPQLGQAYSLKGTARHSRDRWDKQQAAPCGKAR